jgi:predicted 2-oxoglutarate/Fe(II)-dependent dioxygenase YbiX
MDIKNFIKIYDDVLPLKILSNLLKTINTFNFEEGRVVGGDTGVVAHNIRKTKIKNLSPLTESFTLTHWSNFLAKTFQDHMDRFKQDLNILEFPKIGINNIAVLKYEGEGFYTWHVDHCMQAPRTLSCILLLNNDYEGGDICFRNPDGSNEWAVDVKSNRMIIWPSTFLFPHAVKPVTKGIRYSVVAWAI